MCMPDHDLDSGKMLDPTDEDGKLLQEYVGVPSVLYCNEPPPNVQPNAYFRRQASSDAGAVGDFGVDGDCGGDADATHSRGPSITVVLARAISANEEVTIDYGLFYKRDKYAASTSIPADRDAEGQPKSKRPREDALNAPNAVAPATSSKRCCGCGCGCDDGGGGYA